MQAEPLDAFFFCAAIGFDELVMGQTVFGFGWLADDIITFDEVARVVAEADDLRQAGMLFEIV